jgi:hypothetical protein
VEFTQLAAIDRTGRGDRRRWLSCAVPYDLSAIGSADLIIVPNWLSPTETPPEATLEALRLAHAKGARVAGPVQRGVRPGRGFGDHPAETDKMLDAGTVPTEDLRAFYRNYRSV